MLLSHRHGIDKENESQCRKRVSLALAIITLLARSRSFNIQLIFGQEIIFGSGCLFSIHSFAIMRSTFFAVSLSKRERAKKENIKRRLLNPFGMWR